VYLHVGPHKTATTSLQTFFDENRRALQDQGVFVPTSSRSDGGHHELPWAFLGWDLRLLGGEVSQVEPKEWIANVIREAVTLGSASVLLSSEDFSILNKQQWARLLRWLRAGAKKAKQRCQITIVYSTRSLEQLLTSAYPTLVTLGLPLTFEEARGYIRQHFVGSYGLIQSLVRNPLRRLEGLDVPHQEVNFIRRWVETVLPQVDSSLLQGFETRINVMPAHETIDRCREINEALPSRFNAAKPFHWGDYQTLQSLNHLQQVRTLDSGP
jgi:hypothetical protein